jgi:hypothetical protein
MKVNLGFSGAGNGKFRNSEFSFYRDRLIEEDCSRIFYYYI